jgi:SpoVK/Ycf46/Vps4 family AAA+-type ATPase
VNINDAHEIPDGQSALKRVVDEIARGFCKVVLVASTQSEDISHFTSASDAGCRIPHIIRLPDYTDEQLQEMLVDIMHAKFDGFDLEVEGGFDGPYIQAFICMIGRGRGKQNFRNAEALKTCFSKLCDRRRKRMIREDPDYVLEESDDVLFTKADLLGESPAEMASRSKAWKTLQSMVGLERVKASVEALFSQAVVNHRRELQGKKPIKVPLNRCFLGPPGTGKTTIAKLYAQILVDLGLVSGSKVVIKAASDLIGRYLGQSEVNTTAALDSAKNGVLVIDDAHVLVPEVSHNSSGGTDKFRAGIIDTLVAKIQPDPDEGQAVILIGYPDAMYELIERSNPGLARRFPLEEAFHFTGFSEDQLKQILEHKLRKYDLEATPEANEVAREMLSVARHRPNFGNAGHVENLLGRAKARYQARVSLMDISDATEPFLEPHDFDPDYARATQAKERCDELFRDMEGCDYIGAQFQGYQDTFARLKMHGHDPRPYIPLTFVFKGPPGTGKTTVARKVGQIFYDMGFLAEPELIECSVSHLISGYVGQTGQKIVRLFERALGKVLFIDEAYRLEEMGAVDAIGEIVDCVTKKRFARKMIIILAGYEDDMDRLLRMNRGLRSRFPTDVIFHPMQPAECLELLAKLVRKLDVQIDGLKPADPSRRRVLRILSQLVVTKSWANGRDMEALAQKVIEYAFSRKGTRSNLTNKIIVHANDLLPLLKIRLARARKEDAEMAGNYPTVGNDDWAAMNSDGSSPGHSDDGLGREESNIEVLDEPTSTPDMEHLNHASCLSQQGTIPSDLVEMLSTLIGDASAGIDLGRLASFELASSEVELFRRFLTYCLEKRDMDDDDKEILTKIKNLLKVNHDHT